MAVVGERANDRMLVEKRQWFLSRAAALEQLAQRAQAKRTVGECRLAGVVQLAARVSLGPARASLAARAALRFRGLEHGFGPLMGVRADRLGLGQQPDCAALDAADLLGHQVLAQRAESQAPSADKPLEGL